MCGFAFTSCATTDFAVVSVVARGISLLQEPSIGESFGQLSRVLVRFKSWDEKATFGSGTVCGVILQICMGPIFMQSQQPA